MKLSKLDIVLHQMGYDTKRYKDYVASLQKRLNDNWFNHHADDDYWIYWHKCHVGRYDFTGEYDKAIREYHMTPREAYDWVFEEFINK